MVNNCCKTTKKAKKCRRKDGKLFKLPRKFSKKKCMKKIKGFTMRSSCAPYKFCKSNKKKLKRKLINKNKFKI